MRLGLYPLLDIFPVTHKLRFSNSRWMNPMARRWFQNPIGRESQERSHGQTETWNWTHWSKRELFTLKHTRVKEGDWEGWLSAGGYAEFKPQPNSPRAGNCVLLSKLPLEAVEWSARLRWLQATGSWRSLWGLVAGWNGKHTTVFQRKERGRV